METKNNLIRKLEKRRQILSIAAQYPLSVARLWVPHCHRWDGLGAASERARGCGRPMERIGFNRWICRHCDIEESRTSQIEPFLNLGDECTLIAGGNRAGKSEAVCMFAVAWAGGSDAPWVKEWMELNGIPDGIIPRKPQTVIVSALSFGDAIQYLRPKIQKFAPAASIERRWRANDRGYLIFPNGGRIISMSHDQGRAKYQGFSCSLIILDEEHDLDVFEECCLRVADAGKEGRIILSMTPLKGLTWGYDRFITEPERGYKSFRIKGLDNPWLSSVKLLKAVAHMSEATRRSRLNGEFTNQQGLVYPEFHENTHIVRSEAPPKHWPIYFAIDFGVRNPFACLVAAHDENTDTIHIVDMLYRTERTTIQNGEEIKRRFVKKYGSPRFIVCDPESKDGRMILANMGLPNKPAPKHMGLVDTINIMKERLKLDAEGRPALIVHDNCKDLIKEFRLYRWSKTEQRQAPIKKHDHALDALRYLIAFVYRLQRHR